jgi:hypothetical protein
VGLADHLGGECADRRELSRRALRSSAMCYGQALNISPHTVNTHLRRVFAKLGVTRLGCAGRRGTSLDRVMSSPLAASTIDR